jgi:hypothetical protein
MGIVKYFFYNQTLVSFPLYETFLQFSLVNKGFQEIIVDILVNGATIIHGLPF